ncbi:MAG: arylsulfatase [Pirellulaceae bacterium]|nr:MAG: arylsulfatase [Pirellulaceae bacterium]
MGSIRQCLPMTWWMWGACMAVLLASSAVTAQSPSRPNIVLILVDDMGFSDVGCYGAEIRTPNIDRLAARGVRFTQFYNYGRCCPTRAALMTGLHPHQVGIGHMTEPPERPLGISGPYQGHLNDQCTTLAEVLRGAGYRTLMTGKWHLGYHRREDWPLQRGFERYFGCISGACNYFRPTGERGLTMGNEPVEPADDFYATDAFTDYAIQFIDESLVEDGNRPFFLYLAYNAPHWPLNAKWEEFLRYRGQYRDGWEALMRRRLAKQLELGLWEEPPTPAPHEGPRWESLSEQQRDDLDAIMAAYAACIDSIDQNVGRLVGYLEQRGQLDNTLIFFLSDNGACQEGGTLGNGSQAMVRNPPPGTAGVRLGRAWANACNTPFRLYKHFLHEGGACTPCIAHWPAGIDKRLQGGFLRHVAWLPDFMPTVIELAGAEYPADLPPPVGRSLLPLLHGQDQPIHTEPLFWEHEGNAAVRHGPWKLVRRYQKPWELYRIDRDRTELLDLAQEHPEQRDRMKHQWEAWADATGVQYPQRFNMYEYLRSTEK